MVNWKMAGLQILVSESRAAGTAEEIAEILLEGTIRQFVVGRDAGPTLPLFSISNGALSSRALSLHRCGHGFPHQTN